ncbi:hypothetical protein [Flavobacterium humi]|uniref:Uncharacterized protein n=1 Tax=Flavobacterium humi TaxID=2562683 RepID=A0A4Z0LCX8_9FLAO|nr:hypothetical protein [Flavobacterium humi]TGD59727.1 hypothetical protein E4635_01985 [Flavobacterium humi]
MKKTMLLVLLLFCGSMYCQKKKSTSKVAAASPVIAKSGNISAELVKSNFYLFTKNGAKKDTLLLKKFNAAGTPTDCKITPFTAKGIAMYLITWTEKSVSETKLKKEETTITESQIWNPATKTLLIGNTQTAVKIKETVFLDKLKNASETQERMRNSGFAFEFLTDGDFALKDKSSSTKYTYNAAISKYEAVKGNSAPAKKKK